MSSARLLTLCTILAMTDGTRRPEFSMLGSGGCLDTSGLRPTWLRGANHAQPEREDCREECVECEGCIGFEYHQAAKSCHIYGMSPGACGITHQPFPGKPEIAKTDGSSGWECWRRDKGPLDRFDLYPDVLCKGVPLKPDGKF